VTKQEAAKKIAKLKRLAERAGTPAEADTARRTAEQLAREHSLNDDDLQRGAQAAAFDDLVDELSAFVGRKDVPGPVLSAMEMLKKNTKEEDKASALKKVAVGVKAASVFFGFNPTVTTLQETVERVLKKHDIKL
jgi:hypothetical protein